MRTKYFLLCEVGVSQQGAAVTAPASQLEAVHLSALQGNVAASAAIS